MKSYPLALLAQPLAIRVQGTCGNVDTLAMDISVSNKQSFVFAWKAMSPWDCGKLPYQLVCRVQNQPLQGS